MNQPDVWSMGDPQNIYFMVKTIDFSFLCFHLPKKAYCGLKIKN